LNLDHDPVGGAGEPAIAKTGAEMLAVAVGIGPADMDDCPIRTQGRNGDDLFRLTDRVGEFHQIRIELRNAGADAATPRKELLPGPRREQSGIENVLATLPDLDLSGFSVFAVIVANRTIHLLPYIGRDEFFYAARADQQIDFKTGRCGGNDSQILPAIA